MTPLLYSLAALGLTAYVVMDGFDLGAGALHLLLAKNDQERREVIGAIGPYWDGNEVWLLASGGILFAAFPAVLAIAFSGFYLALFLLVWSLILRGIAIEVRSQLGSPLWRAFWDVTFAVSSATLALLFGVALGNVLRGVPTREAWFTLPLFSGWMPRSPVGLVDLYTLLVGLFSLAALAHHGALFLAWKTAGEVNARAIRMASRLFPIVSVLLVVVFVATATMVRLAPSWGAAPLVGLALVGLIASRTLRKRTSPHGERSAFLASGVFLGGSLAAVATTLFPVLLRSVDGAKDITAYDAGVHAYGARAMLTWIPIGLVLVAIYFANLFRVHRGKVDADDHG
jgi:cytochrome d ubiquinol oxidase subunit II